MSVTETRTLLISRPQESTSGSTPQPSRGFAGPRLARCRSWRSSRSRLSGASPSSRSRTRSTIYPLFAFLAVRYAIATGVLGIAGAPRLRSLGRSGFAAGAFLGCPAGHRDRPPDRGPAANDRLEHRLHHRALRRPDPALRARALQDARWPAGLARRRAVGDRARDALGRSRRLDGRRPARARLHLGAGTPDRDGRALREPLRRDRADAGRDGNLLPRLLRDRRRARRPFGPARPDGLGSAPGHGHLRQRARLPDPGLGAATHERGADRACLRAGDCVGRLLRLRARRRPPRVARLGRLRRDPGRNRARGTGCGKGVAPIGRAKLATIRLRFSQQPTKENSAWQRRSASTSARPTPVLA